MIFLISLERLRTSKTTTFWRLLNTTFCQHVVPMGTTFWQTHVFWSLQKVVVFEVWSLPRKDLKIFEKVWNSLLRGAGPVVPRTWYTWYLLPSICDLAPSAQYPVPRTLRSLMIVPSLTYRTVPAPRNIDFLYIFKILYRFSWRDFKPQKLLLLGSFKIQLFVKT